MVAPPRSPCLRLNPKYTEVKNQPPRKLIRRENLRSQNVPVRWRQCKREAQLIGSASIAKMPKTKQSIVVVVSRSPIRTFRSLPCCFYDGHHAN
jgi:hypothetical protein